MTTDILKRVKVIAALCWGAFLCVALWWIYRSGIPIHSLPHVVKHAVLALGFWGPLFIILMHVVRAVTFLPVTFLLLLSGSIYGPVWGTVLNLIGETISAICSFALARFFGRSIVQQFQNDWIRKYDALLSSEGLFTVFAMRILGFPFDVVNIVSGITGVTFKQFVVGTMIGIVPATVTITVLGGAFGNPKNLIVFGALLLGMVGCVVLMRRSKWVKEKMYGRHS